MLIVDKHCSDVCCDEFPVPQIDCKSKLETVSIAEPLQNRQHAQNPNAVNTREKGKEGGTKGGMLEGG